jgi:hypothetical protein
VIQLDALGTLLGLVCGAWLSVVGATVVTLVELGVTVDGAAVLLATSVASATVLPTESAATFVV